MADKLGDKAISLIKQCGDEWWLKCFSQEERAAAIQEALRDVEALQAALAKAEADNANLRELIARVENERHSFAVRIDEADADVAVLLEALEWYEKRVRLLPIPCGRYIDDRFDNLTDLELDEGRRAREAIAKVKP